MSKPFKSLHDLFSQLGPPNTQEQIEEFLRAHSPLSQSILLADASWWTLDQKSFLEDELVKDADWSQAIDQLNKNLRK